MNNNNKKIPFLISILIILHHYHKHRNNPNFTTLDKFVQIKDIDNHETWALFFLGIGIGINFENNEKKL